MNQSDSGTDTELTPEVLTTTSSGGGSISLFYLLGMLGLVIINRKQKINIMDGRTCLPSPKGGGSICIKENVGSGLFKRSVASY